ncbi:MAG TPA: hypothetical protein VLJ18_02695, partial [Thermoanaerobaculia bacterium]|nr:hypothetical protein [Thermoanaerobaculia bacterium]
MSVIPPLGSTWLISLECLGDVPGPRFLDGHTHDGTVGLAQTTDPPFTGTLWAAMRIAPSALILRCLGEAEGPGFHGFLDGRSQDRTVGLAKTTGPPFSGTRWMARVESSGDGSLTLQCLGDIPGPGFHGFLDGRTQDRTVGLAPNTEPPFTGTRWRPHFLGELVILQCLGDIP